MESALRIQVVARYFVTRTAQLNIADPDDSGTDPEIQIAAFTFHGHGLAREYYVEAMPRHADSYPVVTGSVCARTSDSWCTVGIPLSPQLLCGHGWRRSLEG